MKSDKNQTTGTWWLVNEQRGEEKTNYEIKPSMEMAYLVFTQDSIQIDIEGMMAQQERHYNVLISATDGNYTPIVQFYGPLMVSVSSITIKPSASLDTAAYPVIKFESKNDPTDRTLISWKADKPALAS